MRRKLILNMGRICSLVLALVYFGLSTSYAQAAETISPAASLAGAGPDLGYLLGTGDKVRIIVFGQTELNGEYIVDGTGVVQLPLIGQVQAAGRSVSDFQKDVANKLAEGFLVNPSVSVQMVNYRPFYIIGEVTKPGEYPYVNGMSILNAVALAGGYTFRANDSDVYIRRNGSSKEMHVPADETTKVNPGDIIRVPERFF